MRKVALLSALVLIAAACRSGSDAPTSIPAPKESLGAGVHEVLLSHDGVDRYARIYVPESVSRPAPVVLVLHGGGGTAEQMVDSTAMDNTADSHGFIAVYPQGMTQTVGRLTLATWNGGSCCGFAVEENADDVGYISALLDHLESVEDVDTSRVYATGISNGGLMVHRLGIELSDRIVAIAPVASPMPVDLPDVGSDEQPVAVLQLHGLDDPCAKFDGGEQGGCWTEVVNRLLTVAGVEFQLAANDYFEGPPVTESIAAWRDLNVARAGSNGVELSGADSSLELAADVLCTSVGSGDAGQTMLCPIPDHGHSWPGSGVGCRGLSPFVCDVYQDVTGESRGDIDANEVIWEFFSQHIRTA